MKGDKAGGRGGAIRPLRLESQRFRLLSIVVGCFVICLVFLLSSRPDAAAAFGTVSVSPKASLVAARRPVAVKTVRASSSSSADGALGGDFHVDILPQHRQEQSLERTGDKTATEWVRDTVIVEERSGAETSEAETEETEPDRHASASASATATATATAAASNSDDQPAAPGAEKAVQDTAAITGQPAVETTSATAPDGTGTRSVPSLAS